MTFMFHFLNFIHCCIFWMVYIRTVVAHMNDHPKSINIFDFMTLTIMFYLYPCQPCFECRLFSWPDFDTVVLTADFSVCLMLIYCYWLQSILFISCEHTDIDYRVFGLSDVDILIFIMVNSASDPNLHTVCSLKYTSQKICPFSRGCLLLDGKSSYFSIIFRGLCYPTIDLYIPFWLQLAHCHLRNVLSIEIIPYIQFCKAWNRHFCPIVLWSCIVFSFVGSLEFSQFIPISRCSAWASLKRFTCE
jgi:hypothetical protein